MVLFLLSAAALSAVLLAHFLPAFNVQLEDGTPRLAM